ncbi:MAG: plasmid pRiA4b ORF-3 family protein [Spirochaetaceae bacterium]|jgi:hypothetical protein|nr:plasmid pRiA4b ORF-3 family protein [Spirochaetaceae bacterium]
MTSFQEEILYEFLLDRLEPFTLKEVTQAVRAKDNTGFGRLSTEISRLITEHRLAFKVDTNTWLTRAGCFTGARFVIRPSKDELINGVLIPGHRFVPFANPGVLQKEYECFWHGKEIRWTDTEAAPVELYPYYALFGDEFSPQLIARENSKNEDMFNSDPYDDPEEVSIKTLDMRTIYRETGFVPGDVIVVTVKSWRNSSFEFEHCKASRWKKNEFDIWVSLAEKGFMRSFEIAGPSATMEEQIAWAYFLGGGRLCSIPAYSLEDFIFDITDKIETVPFGIESRLWYAGKEIPDYESLKGVQTQSDQTNIEKILFQNNIPISEFVVQSYIYDALFRKDADMSSVIDRIVPPSIRMNKWGLETLAAYIISTNVELRKSYFPFRDQKAGPLRQRAGELHTAVIDLTARLEKGEIDPAWLPKHSFIILSQIQAHASAIMEDLLGDDMVSENELTSIENSLESMLETYEDVKDMIEKSLDNYRHSNIVVVRHGAPPETVWRTVQFGIGGTNIWRRLVLPQTTSLFEIHKLIQALFGWTEIYPFRFIFLNKINTEFLNADNSIKTELMLSDLAVRGFSDISYEYGHCWTVRMIILAVHNADVLEKARCTSGENAAPPEKVEGPLRFRRFVSALDSYIEEERETARAKLGANFKSDEFEVDKCNHQIAHIMTRLGMDFEKPQRE